MVASLGVGTIELGNWRYKYYSRTKSLGVKV
jgi:hypothetical protein